MTEREAELERQLARLRHEVAVLRECVDILTREVKFADSPNSAATLAAVRRVMGRIK